MNNKLTAADAMRRLEEMAAEFSGKKADASAEAKKQAAAYNVAFWENMHTGMPHNDLNVGSDGSGGYLVPDTYNDTLVQGLTEKNVIRQVARVIPTTHRMHIPVSNGIGDATWVIEGEPWSFNEASFGEVILDAYKLATTIRASDEMLEDGGVDLEVFLRDLYVKRIADAEGKAFIHGDGNGKPLGLIYQADVGVISKTEGDISADDLISLEHSVPQSYRDKAVWLMSDDAYRKLRCIIHYQGHPLWDDPLEDGDIIRLLNHPVYICKAMDDVAPGNIPVMFGDFQHYWIGDRGKRVIKRLVERYADRGQVAFVTTERVDAKLVLPEAVKMLKVSGTPASEAEE